MGGVSKSPKLWTLEPKHSNKQYGWKEERSETVLSDSQLGVTVCHRCVSVWSLVTQSIYSFLSANENHGSLFQFNLTNARCSFWMRVWYIFQPLCFTTESIRTVIRNLLNLHFQLLLPGGRGSPLKLQFTSDLEFHTPPLYCFPYQLLPQKTSFCKKNTTTQCTPSGPYFCWKLSKVFRTDCKDPKFNESASTLLKPKASI